jgi:hypothetical protein
MSMLLLPLQTVTQCILEVEHVETRVQQQEERKEKDPPFKGLAMI